MTQLDKAVVLITGASGGFGQELTRQLLQAGSYLILTDLDETKLHHQVATIQQTVKTGKVLACIQVDLGDRAGCEALYERVKSWDWAIDILINNAGIALYGRMDEIPAARWEQLMQINLLAPMRLSALFAADMIARRQGHIVNISSLAGWIGTAGMAHYNASKFGLRGFSEGLYEEVKAYNVRVTAVYPFFSRTPILQAERFGALAKEYRGLPENWVTDPAAVMQATLAAIERNQLHVFPDSTARLLHQIKRYAPKLLDWVGAAFSRRSQGDPYQF